MKSKKAHSKRLRPPTKSFPEAETTISFWMPKDLAVKAWNMAALEKLSFNAYVLKLLLEDADELRRLQKERKAKILKFSSGV